MRQGEKTLLNFKSEGIISQYEPEPCTTNKWVVSLPIHKCFDTDIHYRVNITVRELMEDLKNVFDCELDCTCYSNEKINIRFPRSSFTALNLDVTIMQTRTARQLVDILEKCYLVVSDRDPTNYELLKDINYTLKQRDRAISHLSASRRIKGNFKSGNHSWRGKRKV